MRDQQELDALKSVKEKLRECKDEWLERNAKGQPALGVSTVQQILDYAVEGVTSWDFIVVEQWREDIQKYNKSTGQYTYDGYVYHVKGLLEIPGIGKRSQFGSKPAVGGKDNQNSAYKSAASDALKKCAGLFGVGSSIYSKIKIETEDQQQEQQQYYQPQQQQTQQQDQSQQVTYVNPDGLHQNGEYLWVNNAWIHQNDYYAQQQPNQQPFNPNQGGQYPSPGLTEQQYPQIPFEPTAVEQPNVQQDYGQAPLNEYQQINQVASQFPLDPEAQKMQEVAQQAEEALQKGNIDFPFVDVPTPPPSNEAQPQQFEAQAQPEAQPQQEVQQQDYSAIQYGSPVEPKSVEPEEKPQEQPKTEAPKVDPLPEVMAENPWDSPENREQIRVFQEHKNRLGIQQDNQLLPHVREFFKDEKATIASITPEILPGFNTHLQNIQA